MKLLAEFGEDYSHNTVAWTRLMDDDKYPGAAKAKTAAEWKELLDKAFEKFGPGLTRPKVQFVVSIQFRRAVRREDGRHTCNVWIDYTRKPGCTAKVADAAIAVVKEITSKGEEVK